MLLEGGMEGGEGKEMELKDLDGLLSARHHPPSSDQEDEEEEPKTLTDYVKLVAPHVGLVVFVGIYAVLGALVFYFVESPHEDRVRSAGVEDILRRKEELVGRMWNLSARGQVPLSKGNWTRATNAELEELTLRLFRAFSAEFIAYGDLRLGNGTESRKLWTISSAIFFATTTMATIGYGNIVPVTANGRVICIFFALLGAPLAIITIGDLGKFLSECTIWLYRKLRLLRDYADTEWGFHRGWRPWRRGRLEGDPEAAHSPSHSSGSKGSRGSGDSMDELEDMLMDKTQVPVILVFGILLIYIALGACLFAILEGWTWLESFYFAFITLTTVGFGDLVPDQLEYILIMLLYIGVGLAVTTMCIDLVGIQYIQKIHYFGRKFRGADLLAMLKRKRAIERQLAIAQQEGVLHMYLHEEPPAEWKTPSPSSIYSSPKWVGSPDWSVDNDSPIKELPPSPISTAPSELARLRLYSDPNRSYDTPSPSGPDISLPCSIGTTPSADERSFLYDQRYGSARSCWEESGPSVSPPPISITSDGSRTRRERDWRPHLRSPSASSFKFEFPLDLAAIAKLARAARKNRSCPDRFVPLPPPSQEAVPSRLVSETPRCELASVQSLPSSLSATLLPLPALAELLAPLPPAPTAWPTTHTPRARPATPALAQTPTVETTLPLLLRGRRASVALVGTPLLADFELPRPLEEARHPLPFPTTSLIHSTMAETMKPDVPSLVASAPVGRLEPLGIPSTTLLASAPVKLEAAEEARPFCPRSPDKPVGLSLMEEWSSYQEMEEESRRPRPPLLSVRSPSPSEEPPPLLSALTTPLSSPAESEMDFGAFEILPDSAITSADLRAGTEEVGPLIFHGELPVHSVHHQTVKTETAVLSLLSCPESVLSGDLPPFVVNDNYCFVVDASEIPIKDIAGDEKFWRHTSRPTKYYYSDDLKHFEKVNVITSRGKIHSARFPKNRAGGALTLDSGASSSHGISGLGSPRGLSTSLSASAALATSPVPKKEEDAPLTNVFRVIRFYSFWKTCTSFHRIVTLVDPVLENDVTSIVKKRLFVQYLWRNAKDSDKKRVAKEFDPKTQLTDRPRMSKSPSASSSTGTAPGTSRRNSPALKNRRR